MLLVEDARHFVGALRSVSRSPVAYAELPGARHSFDGFDRCAAARSSTAWNGSRRGCARRTPEPADRTSVTPRALMEARRIGSRESGE
jgi:hypothetical protein